MTPAERAYLSALAAAPLPPDSAEGRFVAHLQGRERGELSPRQHAWLVKLTWRFRRHLIGAKRGYWLRVVWGGEWEDPVLRRRNATMEVR
jgi:hypothetical protein